MTLTPGFPLAAITDEFSPELKIALAAMRQIGITGAELRTIRGTNILDLSDGDLMATQAAVRDADMRVVCIASPLLKCVLPGGPPLDKRFEHDVFASRHTYEDQERLTQRAFEIAHRLEAPLIRVFSFWRTVDPEACQAPILEHLTKLGELAEREGLTIALENEHACNVGTASEAAAVLAQLPARIQLVWDPANALVGGEQPFPEGYRRLQPARIAHVHAKDCHMEGDRPVWGPLGTRDVDWKGQIAALKADGYGGSISLETHWPGPAENKLEASRICGWNLRGLTAQV